MRKLLLLASLTALFILAKAQDYCDTVRVKDTLFLCEDVFPYQYSIDTLSIKDSSIYLLRPISQTDTSYIWRLKGVGGACDTIVMLQVTVDERVYGDTTVEACGSYTWYDSTYTVSTDTATHIFVNSSAGGCDSIVTLHLTVYEPYAKDTSLTICASALDSFVFHMQVPAIDSLISAISDVHSTIEFTKPGNGYECDSTVRLHLTVIPFPKVTLTNSNQTVDSGQSITPITVTIENGTDTIYTGLPDGILFDTVNHQFVGTPTSSGVFHYSVTAHADTCAIDMAEGTITVNALHPECQIHVGHSKVMPNYCVGNVVEIIFNVTGAQGNCFYSWLSPNQYSSNTPILHLDSFAGTDAGQYVLTVTDSIGCHVSDTIVLTNMTPNVQLLPIQDTILCAGDTITLQAALSEEMMENISFTWTKPSGATSSGQNITLSNVTAADNGKYTVTATSTQGSCTASDTIDVQVTVNTPNAGIINVTGSMVICAGDTSVLTASAMDNTGEMMYTWNPTAGLKDTTGSQVSAYPTSTTIYTVTGTASIGSCTAKSTQDVTVTVNPLPDVSISGRTTFCEGDTETLTAETSVNNPIYHWSSGSTTDTIHVTTANTYSVTVTDGNGCKGVESSNVAVLPVPAKPIMSVTPNTNCAQPNGKIIITHPTGNDYTYSIDGGEFQTNRVFSNLGSGSYLIMVRNSSGCETESLVIVESSGNDVDAHASANTPCVGATIMLNGTSSTPGVTYEWSGPNGYSSSQKNPQIPNAEVADAGTYMLTVTQNSTSCSKTVTVDVQVNPLPDVSISGITTFCEGDMATLTAETSVNNPIYHWSSGSTTDTIHVTTANTYSVTVTDNNHCENSASKTVTVNPLPIVTIASDKEVLCAGDSTLMVVTGASDYSWDNGESGDTIWVDTAGTYTVTGTDANGCSNTATITIKIHSLPNVTINGTATVCYGESAHWSAQGGESYKWSSVTDTTTISIDSICNVSTEGQYIVIGVDTNGCSSSDTITLQVNHPSVTLADIRDMTICMGGSFALSAVLQDSIDTINYCWITPNEDTLYQKDFLLSNVSESDAGEYMLIATAADTLNGVFCSASDTDRFSILLNAPVVGAISFSGDTLICYGDTAILSASVADNEGTLTYAWSSFSNDTSNTVSVSPIETTSYTVTVTATQNVNNVTCSVVDSASVNVVVKALPTISISGESAICVGDTATLTVAGGVQYVWSNASQDTLSTNAFLQVVDGGEYWVKGTGENGCVNYDTVIVTVNVPSPEKLIKNECESYTWYDSTYYFEGTYLYPHPDTNGCTQVDTLILSIRHGTHNVIDTTVCNSFEWQFPDSTIQCVSTGVYMFEYENETGCPSADTLYLTVVNSPVDTIFDEICQHEVYAFRSDSVMYDSVGVFERKIYDGYDSLTYCDSLHLLILTVNPVYNIIIDSTVCDKLIWEDSIYTQSDTISKTLITQFGCDSVVTINLIVNHSISTQDTVEVCGQYAWQEVDSVYTSSGDYQYTFVRENGCDSVVTLHLIVNPVYNDTIEQVVCDSLLWEGEVYKQSGIYTDTLSTLLGCDSVVTINLTVNNSIAVRAMAESCGSYDWEGLICDTTGVYFQTFQNDVGCDSVVTLSLTVHPVYNDTIERVVCYQFDWNGETYNYDTLIVVMDTTEYGCDSNKFYRYKVVQPATITLTPASDTTICLNSSVELHASVSGEGNHQTSFLWLDSGWPHPDTVVSPNADTTTYWLNIQDTTTYENTQCVIDSNVSITVVVVPNPPIGLIMGDTMVCQNQFLVYKYSEDMDVEQYEYEWYWNGYTLLDTDAVTLYTPVLGIDNDTTYQLVVRVTAKDEQRCSSETALDVYVCPSVTPSKVTVLRKGMSNILYCDTASVPTASTDIVEYQWGYTVKSTGEEQVPAPSWNQRYYAYLNGIDTVANLYWVETRVEGNNNFCVNRSYYLEDPQGSPLSVDDLQPFEVHAYVSGDLLLVDVDNPQMRPVKADLYDIQGRLIHHYFVGDDMELHVQLPFSYAKGVYLLRLMVGNNVYSTKLIR